MDTLGRILHSLYAPPLRFLAWIMENYEKNRNRVKKIKEKPRVAALLRNAAMLMLLLWALIWVFAPDEYRERLTNEFKAQMVKYSGETEDAPAGPRAPQDRQPDASQSVPATQENH